MTQQAGIGAFFLPKAQGHVSIRNIVDLVGSRAEQQCIHDARHMTGNAAAAFGVGAVMGVGRQSGYILELLMAIYTRPIWPVWES